MNVVLLVTTLRASSLRSWLAALAISPRYFPPIWRADEFLAPCRFEDLLLR